MATDELWDRTGTEDKKSKKSRLITHISALHGDSFPADACNIQLIILPAAQVLAFRTVHTYTALFLLLLLIFSWLKVKL